MRKSIYPGSFDPITLGHVDIIKRIQSILGPITLLIAQSSKKIPTFSAEERKMLAEKAVRGIPGVDVDIYEGLTVDYARDHGANVIVRGLRAVTDFEYELVMANMNKKLAPEIETMIVFASPEFYYVSSNTVKEVALHGGSVKGLVPAHVEHALQAKFPAKLSKKPPGNLGKMKSKKMTKNTASKKLPAKKPALTTRKATR